ncbi:hypothetical protein ABB39_08445 [Levilactobacillus brevis]|uniref:protein-export chaperone SecB n=1 Tax=Levilactobacillus brevis TaxID=1580 RepID=UPI0007608D93|nr:protein-export chaperone SecB [Levilactobacillus brevis]KWT47441.1 hypothetical protein ABB39_08445 [Levilactobacillus brevis]MCX7511803.1 protein-export chaperone SecB [Levilactobacillus brevis]QWK86900.1 protein-export chaperone SecB [Levilactobacillus brevis]
MDTETNKSFFQFSNPELLQSIFIVNPEFSEDNDNKEKSMAISSNVSNPEKNEKDNSCYSDVQLTVENMSSIDFTDNDAYYLHVSMGARFLWPDEVDKHQYMSLLQINAPSLLLSYVRPIVKEITENSRYTSVNIPFIDFRDSSENISKKEN